MSKCLLLLVLLTVKLLYSKELITMFRHLTHISMYLELHEFFKTLIFLVLSISAFSAEIDSYSYISNSKISGFRTINKTVNTWLDQAIVELNENEVECVVDLEESDEFYDIIKEGIASPFIGHVVAVHFEEELSENMITKTPMYSSIYNRMSWYEGFSVNLKGLLGITVDHGRKIGVDKVGHFFVEGWGFYKRAYLKGDINIESALRWGKFTEETYFGKTTTGVYSNADLVVNFNGMRFWNHLLLLNADSLSSQNFKYFKKPLLSCKDSKWIKNNRFSFSYYLDKGWDEERNCNYYDTEHILEQVKIQASLKLGYHELKKRSGRVCPVVKYGCELEKRKYGKYAKDLLHGSCFNDELSYKVDTETYRPNSILNRFNQYDSNVSFEEVMKIYSLKQVQ